MYFTIACIAYRLGGRGIVKKLISSDKTDLDEKVIEELDKVSGYKPKPK